jgi:hypothetical protein
VARAARRIDPDHPPRQAGDDPARSKAADFAADVGSDDPQELMARLTGNYKRGNERMAKNHPRNR